MRRQGPWPNWPDRNGRRRWGRGERRHNRTQGFFDRGVSATYRWRRQQLTGLRALITDNLGRIQDALYADLGKPAAEVVITETGPVLGEIDHALRRLRRWMRARPVPLPYLFLPATAHRVRQPLGWC
ncbi:aldehyde dehydrogenase family protein [Tessaracoccus coleopterorum]|uniref:hypothetical protein n=1 Tax=Tessaracoccus coleopterorum TaxID=2714950 RepID=UPI0018D4BC20|nr:hypothetical protein [Tessaracoccus coleopterorum]